MEISGKTRLFGLIGSPVEHSKSPAMYNYCFDKWKLDYKYLAFDVDKNQTANAIQAFRTFQMMGANITMPCKQEVLKYLDEISPAARLVGACNTIVNHDGVLTGYITDGEGYIENLRHEGVEVKGKKITLLGVAVSYLQWGREIDVVGSMGTSSENFHEEHVTFTLNRLIITDKEKCAEENIKNKRYKK